MARKLCEATGVAGEVPAACYENCEPLWSAAMSDDSRGNGYLLYPFVETEECKHDDTPLVMSHDTMVTSGPKSRSYVITDLCEPCGTEYGQNSWDFTCPNESRAIIH